MSRFNLVAAARRLAWPLGLAISSALAGSLAAQIDDSAGDSHPPVRATRPAPTRSDRGRDEERLGERLREGTRLNDVAGSFQFSGDRVAFHPDGKGESYRVLENLALERISRVLGQARGTPNWTVSGMVTEYRGSNYLLVTKAVVKTGESTASP